MANFNQLNDEYFPNDDLFMVEGLFFEGDQVYRKSIREQIVEPVGQKSRVPDKKCKKYTKYESFECTREAF